MNYITTINILNRQRQKALSVFTNTIKSLEDTISKQENLKRTLEDDISNITTAINGVDATIKTDTEMLTRIKTFIS